MELDLFKESFEKLATLLEGKINFCFFSIFSPGDTETEYPQEDYSQYQFVDFFKSAQDHLDRLFLKVHSLYTFIVDDTLDTEKSDKTEELSSELFRSFNKLERSIYKGGSDLVAIYHKLIGDYPERCENSTKKESADGYTQFVIEELRFLLDVTDEINKYLVGCEKTSDCCCEGTCSPSSPTLPYCGRH